jgi:Flp pilus assembly protein CpaB
MAIAWRTLLVFVFVFQIALVLAKARPNAYGRSCSDCALLVVASRDLDAGVALTYDDLTQRALPEQFLRARDVRPDEASALIGQRLRYDVPAGEPLSRSEFVDGTVQGSSAITIDPAPPSRSGPP